MSADHGTRPRTLREFVAHDRLVAGPGYDKPESQPAAAPSQPAKALNTLGDLDAIRAVKPVRGPRRFGHLTVRLTLALACLAALAIPFPIALYIQKLHREVAQQFAPPPARLSPDQLARFRAAVPGGAPLILAYHDIEPGVSKSPYVVTAEAFEDQMAMLKAAGYRTLTAEEFVRYLKTGKVAPHAVLITFDDGTNGLWTHADKILARYGFHATSFLITSKVGQNWGYYLSWPEVQRMERSGRWDFGSHTHNLHYKLPLTADGKRKGPALSSLLWLPAQGRRETVAEFRHRVDADLQASITDITRHGLPRPQMFAYPFSEDGGSPDGPKDPQAAYVANRLKQMFAGVVTNNQLQQPIGRRVIASGLLPRIEVTGHDTATDVFDRMQSAATLPVGDASRLNDPKSWIDEAHRPANIALRGGGLAFRDRKGTYAYAAYAPQRTADWQGYAVSAVATNLTAPGGPTATVRVLDGSHSRVDVRVSAHELAVYRDVAGRSVKVYEHRFLADASQRALAVLVRPGGVEVQVSGQTMYQMRIPPGETGGFALASGRNYPSQSFAQFTRIQTDRLTS